MKITLLFALTGTLCAASWAQTDNPTTLVPKTAPANIVVTQVDGKQAFQIALKNIKPSLMAYLLDSAHQKMPDELRPPFAEVADATKKPGEKTPAQDKTQVQIFPLPAGVKSIVADDSQKTLLVFGTQQGVTELASTIAFLDRPVPKVDLTVQYILIDDAVIDQLFPIAAPQTPSVTRVGNGFQKLLTPFTNSGKATVVSSPQITATNNFPVGLVLGTTVSVQEPGKPWIPLSPKKTTPSLEQTTLLTITPTINNDNSITLLVHTMPGTPDKSQYKNLEAIANAPDGEVVVLRIPHTTNAPQNSRTTLIALTAHAVKLVAK